MNITPAQRLALSTKFSAQLNALLTSVRDSALAQFEHNLDSNVPAGMDPEWAVEHAIVQGLSSAAGRHNGFAIEPSIYLAASILEDVNAHTEAKPLFDSIADWRKGRS